MSFDRHLQGVILLTSLYLLPLFQLIFRKVSDVKKEKELAERRKNDPALNHTQDHLVRKLFSKFKRAPSADERGGGGGGGGGGGRRMLDVAERRDVEKGAGAPGLMIQDQADNNGIPPGMETGCWGQCCQVPKSFGHTFWQIWPDRKCLFCIAFFCINKLCFFFVLNI